MGGVGDRTAASGVTPCPAPTLVRALEELGAQMHRVEGTSFDVSRSLQTLLIAGLVVDSIRIRSDLERAERPSQSVIVKAANTYLAIHGAVLATLHDDPNIDGATVTALESCMNVAQSCALDLTNWESTSFMFYFGEIADIAPFCAALEAYETLIEEFVLDIRCRGVARHV